MHRDLKPENILCGEELEDLKIADFGLSKMVLPKEKMDSACGTLSYVAPEVLTMQGYGREADLWSVGVIMFLLLCGKLPFDGEDHNEIIRSTIQVMNCFVFIFFWLLLVAGAGCCRCQASYFFLTRTVFQLLIVTTSTRN